MQKNCQKVLYILNNLVDILYICVIMSLNVIVVTSHIL